MFRSPRWRFWAVPVAVLVVCAILTYLHKRAERRGTAGAVASDIRRFVLSPPARAVQKTRSWWSVSIASLFNGPRLARQNSKLRSQVAVLSEQDRDLQDEAVENQRLRALLGFESRSSLALLPAQVLSLKPSPLRDTITLSRGLRDHVKQKMVVLDPSGALVGQVIDVTFDTCDVLMLTDDQSSAGALVVASGRASSAKSIVGLCEGDRSAALKLMDIASDADVRVGDTVVTSGLGPIYPRNILIGTVKTMTFDKSTYLKGADIEPSADFNHIQEAFIVMQPSRDQQDSGDDTTAGATP